MHELKIGDTVFLDGKEFIIYCLTNIYDIEGACLRIEAMDPLRAQRHMEKQRLAKKQLEGAVDYIEKMAPVVDDMIKGDEWKTKEE